MIKHDPVLPPEFIYPIDDWRIVERTFSPEFLAQNETCLLYTSDAADNREV